MPRRKAAPQRSTIPDPRYQNEVAARFISRMMWNGKRSLSARMFYRALENAAERLKAPPLSVLHEALANVKPEMEVKSRRVGGSTYQIPIEVEKRRQEVLAMRWIIGAARGRRGQPFEKRLSIELHEAYNNSGLAVKRKEEIHRTAEANKAFAHYRW